MRVLFRRPTARHVVGCLASLLLGLGASTLDATTASASQPPAPPESLDTMLDQLLARLLNPASGAQASPTVPPEQPSGAESSSSTTIGAAPETEPSSTTAAPPTEAPDTEPPPTDAPVTEVPGEVPVIGVIEEPGVGAERMPESSVETTDSPVEETQPPPVDTTVPELPAEPVVSVPPVNPVWLQTGNRRSSAGSAGATAPLAGRAPAGERLAPVDEIDVILATIRQLESGNRYDTGPNTASASGAYQYISSTWNGYGGYPEAYLAPPSVQDERARGDVERILVRFAGDVSMVPVMWYYPRAAIDPSWMDRVPNPAGGNRFTIREYQTRWLDTYQANHQAYAQYFEPSTDPGRVSVVSIDEGTLDWQMLQQTLIANALEGQAGATPALSDHVAIAPGVSLAVDAAATTVESSTDPEAAARAVAEAAARAGRAQRALTAEALAGQALPTTTATSTTLPPQEVAPSEGGLSAVASVAVPIIDTAPATELPLEDPAAVGADVIDATTTTTTVPAFVPNDGSLTDVALALAERSAIPADALVADAYRSLVFPVLGPVTYADGWGDCRDDCRRRHVGTDIIGVQMQPLLAAVDGTITRISPDPLGISGVVITITDAEGWRYNYFHVNNDTPGTDDGLALDAWELAPGLQLGSQVVAGQIIGYMGNSGNAEASTTHLHFEIRDPSGLAHPSYAALQVAAARQACAIGIGPWSTPQLAEGADMRAGSIDGLRLAQTAEGQLVDLDTGFQVEADQASSAVSHTVVAPLFGNGQWVIDTDGRATATGDAALIIPSRELDCAPGPVAPFGTDAAGWITAPDTGVLVGSTLEGVELTDTVLGGLLRPAPTAVGDPIPGAPLPVPVDGANSVVEPADHVHAFSVPSTGELIVLVFPMLPEPAAPAVDAEAAVGRAD